MKKLVIIWATIGIFTSCNNQNAENNDSGWVSIFDGESLDGWKISENPEAIRVEDGNIVVHGNRAHLFYVGPVENHNFQDFEFKADIMTFPGANSGMFIHTEYQDEGWPSKGYEIQVNNSHTDWRRTGSIYAVQDVKEAPAKDNEWFTQHIIVEGNQITVKVNDEVINELTVTEDSRLNGGTIALQAHDPESKVYYRNIMVKPLSE
ncbi:DUF1080 domain-containing protein [soil metagenome]